jgi:hypothetical protein
MRWEVSTHWGRELQAISVGDYEHALSELRYAKVRTVQVDNRCLVTYTASAVD